MIQDSIIGKDIDANGHIWRFQYQTSDEFDGVEVPFSSTSRVWGGCGALVAPRGSCDTRTNIWFADCGTVSKPYRRTPCIVADPATLSVLLEREVGQSKTDATHHTFITQQLLEMSPIDD